MPHEGTKQTQIRFTDEDKAKVNAIKDHYGLPSFAAAVRYAVNCFGRHPSVIHHFVPKKNSKKGA